jgi:hypothetical protein
MQSGRYEWVVAGLGRDPHSRCMTAKRALAGFLWLISGWSTGAAIALVFSASPVLGPILGVAAAGFVLMDPRGVFWGHRSPIVSAELVREAA